PARRAHRRRRPLDRPLARPGRRDPRPRRSAHRYGAAAAGHEPRDHPHPPRAHRQLGARVRQRELTMRAIRQYEFGGPDVFHLETLEDPVPGPGEVAIAVQVAGVHLLDTSIRAGTGFGSLPPPDLPMIPGREVAGVVDAIGPDTDDRWLGQRVVVHLGGASGGYASRAVAPVDALFT